MAVNDKLRLTTQGTLYGVSSYNVFNYIETGASASFSSEKALAVTFLAQIIPAWLAAVSEDFVMHCITVVKLGAGPAAPYVEYLTSSNTGDESAPALPANRVMSISLYSAPGMTAAIGRKSFSGIPIAEESDNAITSDQFGLLETLANLLIGGMSGAGGFSVDHVIRSGDLITDSAIIAVTPHPQVRTLRGRTPRLC